MLYSYAERGITQKRRYRVIVSVIVIHHVTSVLTFYEHAIYFREE